jgi:hypothetical protein
MKKHVPVFLLVSFTILGSCAHKYYVAEDFEDLTMEHKVVAVLPAVMIFTGTQPKNLTEEDIAKIEESESTGFQQSLYNNILEYANNGKYVTTINFQDITTTQNLLEQNHISARDSWKMTDKELSAKLGVDAIVRMRVTKQRYMSDLASYGIGVARQVVFKTGIGNKIPVPNVHNKTNDIITSCNLVSDGQTLWNDHYTRASDYNISSQEVVEQITENFGKHFPYKKKRK